MTLDLMKYPDRDMLAIDLADKIAVELKNALRNQERATLIVPGGSTPAPVFDDLCAAKIDWGRVDVMLSDERWVPEADPASNAAMLRKRLFVDQAKEANFVPFYRDGMTPEDAIAELESAIVPMLPASVALVGMGADMHTASLFPNGDNLQLGLDANAPTLVAMRAPGLPQVRISLSARVLREAISLHLVVTGNDKLEAVKKARKLDAKEAPISALLDDALIHWAE